MVSHNNAVPNDHLRKYWWDRVKTYFDDPARARRRRDARATRAKKIAPRPVEGPLRPLIHCPTVRYNQRLRLGRGFTHDELKAAGLDPSRARFFGIAIDSRREHTKDAALRQKNIDRLVEYKSKMVRVTKEVKPEAGHVPSLFAVPKADQATKWRVIKAEEKNVEVFKTKHEAHKAYRASLKQKEADKRKK